MNRTTATCIAGMRSKTTSRIRIHVLPGPREAEPCTRFTRRFLAFGVGIVRQETAMATRAQPVGDVALPQIANLEPREAKLFTRNIRSPCTLMAAGGETFYA